jgi:hypothetical protein
MGVLTATMQVCAPFPSAEGYEQVNGNPSLNVTLITGGVSS